MSDAAEAARVSAATLADAAGADIHALHCVKRPGPLGGWGEEDEPARRSAAAALRQQVERTRVATAVAAHLDRAILVVPPQPPHDDAP